MSDKARGVAVDAADNIYISGETGGSFPGFTIQGIYDWFVAKLDSGGTLQWTRQIGGEGAEQAGKIAVGGSGDIYMTGTTENLVVASIVVELAVVKLSSAGDTQYSVRLGTGQTSRLTQGRSIAADASGNVYVGGRTSGSFSGFTNAGKYDAFVLKLDPSGAMQWVRQLGTSEDDVTSSIHLGADGAVYVAGTAHGSLPGLVGSGYDDVFVAKYDSSGAQQWIQQEGTNPEGAEVAFDLGIGRSALYIVGCTTRSWPDTTFSGGLDGFVLKYGLDGTRQWVRQIGTPGDEIPTAVTADDGDHAYVSGDGGGFYRLPGGGGGDVFLFRMGPDGSLL
jgi:hypothetical protein